MTQNQNQEKNVEYKSPLVGQEISCVFNGVAEEFFNGLKLKSLLENVLVEENFSILEKNSHNFLPKGFTCFYLLGESHAAIHTYPEHNSIYFSIYSCRGPKDAEPVFKKFKSKIKHKSLSYYKNNKVRVKEKD
ncbi:MAG: S-adenosylmethionine decarboxylase [Nanoarchaeota archaeon]|nr:S-adenosylmethionine decarboxylase [Nanoarchaeota archaeon]MBU1028129.1 S-adenosylmethionine decarboxylase [Nanoarchaeota archaeon]